MKAQRVRSGSSKTLSDVRKHFLLHIYVQPRALSHGDVVHPVENVFITAQLNQSEPQKWRFLRTWRSHDLTQQQVRLRTINLAS